MKLGSATYGKAINMQSVGTTLTSNWDSQESGATHDCFKMPLDQAKTQQTIKLLKPNASHAGNLSRYLTHPALICIRTPFACIPKWPGFQLNQQLAKDAVNPANAWLVPRPCGWGPIMMEAYCGASTTIHLPAHIIPRIFFESFTVHRCIPQKF